MAEFAKNMLAQKLMSQKKTDPFSDSKFFQPSDATTPPRYTGMIVPIERNLQGNWWESDVDWAVPKMVTGMYDATIGNMDKLFKGELGYPSVDNPKFTKAASDMAMNVAGGGLLGSKIPGAVPKNALASNLIGGGSKSIKSLDDIKSKYSNVDLSISSNPEGITLNKIVVPKEARSEGIGTSVMNDLIKFADQNNLKIAVTPDSAFGGSKTRLKSFYKKFGFVNNKGRNKDFSFRESMVRRPKNLEAKRLEIENRRKEANIDRFGYDPKDNVIKLDPTKKKANTVPRDESSGHAADFVPVNFGPPAHNMNMKISEEFAPKGFSTMSTDMGNNYENLKYFISSSRGTPEFKEEVDFYRKLFAIKGKPDAEITVYRASPTNDLRYGDLITPIKSDAQNMVDQSKITRMDIRDAGRANRLKGDKPVDLQQEKMFRTMDSIMDILPIKENTPSKLFEYKIKAKDLRWDGNGGLIRWGYFPSKN